MAERILVVEDEEPIRKIIVSMLRTVNFECHEAADGLEALALLESGDEFSLVLSSLKMPNLDGLGLLERVKDKYPDIPVVIVTSLYQTSVVLTAMRNGAYDYLLKPFDREQLLNAVRRALENRRLKMENRNYQMNLESLVEARTEQLQSAMGTLERSHDMTLEGFGDALNLKDSATEGHSKRVTAFSLGIARAMGLPKDKIVVIARGAFLHDIGKMAIPDKILLKPDALTSDEYAVIKEHCLLGYKMVRKLPFLADPSEIVYSHHERFEGTGYPRGLKGEQIPLGARIVAVANTLDSITSDLPYRSAHSFGAAREEIRRWSGRQFDPDIVNTFLSMPDQIWADLGKAIQSDIQQNAHPAKPESSGTSDVIQMADFVDSASVNTELDGLTGLRTPRAFFRDFQRYLNDSNQGVALLVADFDHFKRVNDKYGHSTGDELLRALALLFLEHCDLLDAVPYRFGGSVFDVILPGKNSEAAREFAESIRIAVEFFRYRDFALTVSIGMAEAPKDGRTTHDLADKAYAALRRAKTNGRNRVEVA
jgi:diguanylate cyclase (GGDEF)-like protein/putative nucleotidyltransferase with HDIG domain